MIEHPVPAFHIGASRPYPRSLLGIPTRYHAARSYSLASVRTMSALCEVIMYF
jgi:hypothetical protein